MIKINELYHYAVKGQKKGVRRYQNADGTWTELGKERRRIGKTQGAALKAENYSDAQRIQDRRIYSRGAERRINKKMLKGEGIKSARAYEADRIEKFRKAADYSGKAGKVAGSFAGAIGGYIVSAKAINAVNDVINSPFVVDTPFHRFIRNNQAAVEFGMQVATPMLMTSSVIVGSKLGKRAAESAAMLAGGYSPNKKRN